MDPNLGFAGPTQKEVYSVLSYLKQNGVDFKLYPLHLMPKVQDGALKNKFQIDHNKLYVIDENIFITGGFNLFDIGVINRDLMLKIEGPTAEDAAKLMKYEWSLSDKFVAPKDTKDLFVVKNSVDMPGDSMVKIVKTDPFESTTKPAMIEAIDNATQSVYLGVLEYSDLDITRALIRAHKRGVDVRVMMDRKNTNDKYAGGIPVPTYFPNILPATELFKNRVPVKWYDAKIPGQELHLKMIVVDGKKLITGSTNFTRQAFTTFRETSVIVEGGTAPEKMVRAFMEDWLNNSTAVKKVTLGDKIKAKVVEYMDRRYYAWW
jgi:phosphatidylserine/phosphatidylglycerophosphate/cardiolipin synthase-like enzyme